MIKGDAIDMIVIIVEVLIIVIGGVWAWYKFWQQNKFNLSLQEQKTELDKSLKNHEQQLNRLSEKQKYLNQRKLTDFSLFANKKHERVIDLYEKLSFARNQVLWRHSPLRMLPTFTDYNEDDMLEFLDEFKITRATKGNLLESWKNEPQKGVQEIRKIMYSQEDFNTEKSVAELAKSHRQAELYLSSDISRKIEGYVKILSEMQVLCSRENREQINEGDPEKRKELAVLIESEFTSIVEELKQWLLNDSE